MSNLFEAFMGLGQASGDQRSHSSGTPPAGTGPTPGPGPGTPIPSNATEHAGQSPGPPTPSSVRSGSLSSSGTPITPSTQQKTDHDKGKSLTEDVKIVEPDSLRTFTIPKRKKLQKNLLETLSMTSREYTREILPVISKSFKDPQSVKAFQYHRVQTVHNPELLSAFFERRKEMRQDGYSEKDVGDSYAFLCVETETEVRRICEDGVLIANLSITCLGSPQMGVYLARHADIVRHHGMNCGYQGKLIILKFMKGKVKSVTETRGGPPLEPTPNYDCHVSKAANIDLSSVSLQLAFESTQVYIYEYGDLGVEARPRQVCPYAVIHFTYTGEARPQRMPTLTRQLPAKNSPRIGGSGSQWTSPHTQSGPPRLNFTPGPRTDSEGKLRHATPSPPVRSPVTPSTASRKPPLSSGVLNELQSNIGNEAEGKGWVVWEGQLASKGTTMCDVELVTYGSAVRPACIGPVLNIVSRVPLSLVKTKYLHSIAGLSREVERNVGDRWYRYGMLRPARDGMSKFNQVMTYLLRKESAATVKLDDSTEVVLLTNCDITQQLGLSEVRSHPLILHVIFISVVSRLKILQRPRHDLDIREQIYGDVDVHQRPPVVSPDVWGPQTPPALEPGSMFKEPPQPTRIVKDVSGSLVVKDSIYDNGFQKLVSADSLLYRKVLVKVFHEQAVVQEKINLERGCSRLNIGIASMPPFPVGAKNSCPPMIPGVSAPPQPSALLQFPPQSYNSPTLVSPNSMVPQTQQQPPVMMVQQSQIRSLAPHQGQHPLMSHPQSPHQQSPQPPLHLLQHQHPATPAGLYGCDPMAAGSSGYAADQTLNPFNSLSQNYDPYHLQDGSVEQQRHLIQLHRPNHPHQPHIEYTPSCLSESSDGLSNLTDPNLLQSLSVGPTPLPAASSSLAASSPTPGSTLTTSIARSSTMGSSKPRPTEGPKANTSLGILRGLGGEMPAAAKMTDQLRADLAVTNKLISEEKKRKASLASAAAAREANSSLSSPANSRRRDQLPLPLVSSEDSESGEEAEESMPQKGSWLTDEVEMTDALVDIIVRGAPLAAKAARETNLRDPRLPRTSTTQIVSSDPTPETCLPTQKIPKEENRPLKQAEVNVEPLAPKNAQQVKRQLAPEKTVKEAPQKTSLLDQENLKEEVENRLDEKTVDSQPVAPDGATEGDGAMDKEIIDNAQDMRALLDDILENPCVKPLPAQDDRHDKAKRRMREEQRKERASSEDPDTMLKPRIRVQKQGVRREQLKVWLTKQTGSGKPPEPARQPGPLETKGLKVDGPQSGATVDEVTGTETPGNQSRSQNLDCLENTAGQCEGLGGSASLSQLLQALAFYGEICASSSSQSGRQSTHVPASTARPLPGSPAPGLQSPCSGTAASGDLSSLGLPSSGNQPREDFLGVSRADVQKLGRIPKQKPKGSSRSSPVKTETTLGNKDEDGSGMLPGGRADRRHKCDRKKKPVKPKVCDDKTGTVESRDQRAGQPVEEDCDRAAGQQLPYQAASNSCPNPVASSFKCDVQSNDAKPGLGANSRAGRSVGQQALSRITEPLDLDSDVFMQSQSSHPRSPPHTSSTSSTSTHSRPLEIKDSHPDPSDLIQPPFDGGPSLRPEVSNPVSALTEELEFDMQTSEELPPKVLETGTGDVSHEAPTVSSVGLPTEPEHSTSFCVMAARKLAPAWVERLMSITRSMVQSSGRDRESPQSPPPSSKPSDVNPRVIVPLSNIAGPSFMSHARVHVGQEVEDVKVTFTQDPGKTKEATALPELTEEDLLDTSCFVALHGFPEDEQESDDDAAVFLWFYGLHMMLLEEKSDNERSVKGRYKDTKQTPHCEASDVEIKVKASLESCTTCSEQLAVDSVNVVRTQHGARKYHQSRELTGATDSNSCSDIVCDDSLCKALLPPALVEIPSSKASCISDRTVACCLFSTKNGTYTCSHQRESLHGVPDSCQPLLSDRESLCPRSLPQSQKCLISESPTPVVLFNERQCELMSDICSEPPSLGRLPSMPKVQSFAAKTEVSECTDVNGDPSHLEVQSIVTKNNVSECKNVIKPSHLEVPHSVVAKKGVLKCRNIDDPSHSEVQNVAAKKDVSECKNFIDELCHSEVKSVAAKKDVSECKDVIDDPSHSEDQNVAARKDVSECKDIIDEPSCSEVQKVTATKDVLECKTLLDEPSHSEVKSVCAKNDVSECKDVIDDPSHSEDQNVAARKDVSECKDIIDEPSCSEVQKVTATKDVLECKTLDKPSHSEVKSVCAKNDVSECKDVIDDLSHSEDQNVAAKKDVLECKDIIDEPSCSEVQKVTATKDVLECKTLLDKPSHSEVKSVCAKNDVSECKDVIDDLSHSEDQNVAAKKDVSECKDIIDEPSCSEVQKVTATKDVLECKTLDKPSHSEVKSVCAKNDVSECKDVIDDLSHSEDQNVAAKKDVLECKNFIDEPSRSEVQNVAAKEDVSECKNVIDDPFRSEVQSIVDKKDVSECNNIDDTFLSEVQSVAAKEDVSECKNFIDDPSRSEVQSIIDKKDVSKCNNIDDPSCSEVQSVAAKKDVSECINFIDDLTCSEVQTVAAKKDVSECKNFIDDPSRSEVQSVAPKQISEYESTTAHLAQSRGPPSNEEPAQRLSKIANTTSIDSASTDIRLSQTDVKTFLSSMPSSVSSYTATIMESTTAEHTKPMEVSENKQSCGVVAAKSHRAPCSYVTRKAQRRAMLEDTGGLLQDKPLGLEEGNRPVDDGRCSDDEEDGTFPFEDFVVIDSFADDFKEGTQPKQASEEMKHMDNMVINIDDVLSMETKNGTIKDFGPDRRVAVGKRKRPDEVSVEKRKRIKNSIRQLISDVLHKRTEQSYHARSIDESDENLKEQVFRTQSKIDSTPKRKFSNSDKVLHVQGADLRQKLNFIKKDKQDKLQQDVKGSKQNDEKIRQQRISLSPMPRPTQKREGSSDRSSTTCCPSPVRAYKETCRSMPGKRKSPPAITRVFGTKSLSKPRRGQSPLPTNKVTKLYSVPNRKSQDKVMQVLESKSKSRQSRGRSPLVAVSVDVSRSKSTGGNRPTESRSESHSRSSRTCSPLTSSSEGADTRWRSRRSRSPSQCSQDQKRRAGKMSHETSRARSPKQLTGVSERTKTRLQVKPQRRRSPSPTSRLHGKKYSAGDQVTDKRGSEAPVIRKSHKVENYRPSKFKLAQQDQDRMDSQSDSRSRNSWVQNQGERDPKPSQSKTELWKSENLKESHSRNAKPLESLNGRVSSTEFGSLTGRTVEIYKPTVQTSSNVSNQTKLKVVPTLEKGGKEWQNDWHNEAEVEHKGVSDRREVMMTRKSFKEDGTRFNSLDRQIRVVKHNNLQESGINKKQTNINEKPLSDPEQPKAKHSVDLVVRPARDETFDESRSCNKQDKLNKLEEVVDAEPRSSLATRLESIASSGGDALSQLRSDRTRYHPYRRPAKPPPTPELDVFKHYQIGRTQDELLRCLTCHAYRTRRQVSHLRSQNKSSVKQRFVGLSFQRSTWAGPEPTPEDQARPNINDPDEVDEIYTSADVPNFDDRRELCKKLEPLLGGTVEIEARETGQTTDVGKDRGVKGATPSGGGSSVKDLRGVVPERREDSDTEAAQAIRHDLPDDDTLTVVSSTGTLGKRRKKKAKWPGLKFIVDVPWFHQAYHANPKKDDLLPLLDAVVVEVKDPRLSPELPATSIYTRETETGGQHEDEVRPSAAAPNVSTAATPDDSRMEQTEAMHTDQPAPDLNLKISIRNDHHDPAIPGQVTSGEPKTDSALASRQSALSPDRSPRTRERVTAHKADDEKNVMKADGKKKENATTEDFDTRKVHSWITASQPYFLDSGSSSQGADSIPPGDPPAVPSDVIILQPEESDLSGDIPTPKQTLTPQRSPKQPIQSLPHQTVPKEPENPCVTSKKVQSAFQDFIIQERQLLSQISSKRSLARSPLHPKCPDSATRPGHLAKLSAAAQTIVDAPGAEEAVASALHQSKAQIGKTLTALVKESEPQQVKTRTMVWHQDTVEKDSSFEKLVRSPRRTTKEEQHMIADIDNKTRPPSPGHSKGKDSRRRSPRSTKIITDTVTPEDGPDQPHIGFRRWDAEVKKQKPVGHTEERTSPGQAEKSLAWVEKTKSPGRSERKLSPAQALRHRPVQSDRPQSPAAADQPQSPPEEHRPLSPPEADKPLTEAERPKLRAQLERCWSPAQVERPRSQVETYRSYSVTQEERYRPRVHNRRPRSPPSETYRPQSPTDNDRSQSPVDGTSRRSVPSHEGYSTPTQRKPQSPDQFERRKSPVQAIRRRSPRDEGHGSSIREEIERPRSPVPIERAPSSRVQAKENRVVSVQPEQWDEEAGGHRMRLPEEQTVPVVQVREKKKKRKKEKKQSTEDKETCEASRWSATREKLHPVSHYAKKTMSNSHSERDEDLQDLLEEKQVSLLHGLHQLYKGKPVKMADLKLDEQFSHLSGLSLGTQLECTFVPDSGMVKRAHYDTLKEWLTKKPLDTYLLGKLDISKMKPSEIKPSLKTDETVRECLDEFNSQIYELLLGHSINPDPNNVFPRPRNMTEETVDKVFRQVRQYMDFVVTQAKLPGASSVKENGVNETGVELDGRDSDSFDTQTYCRRYEDAKERSFVKDLGKDSGSERGIDETFMKNRKEANSDVEPDAGSEDGTLTADGKRHARHRHKHKKKKRKHKKHSRSPEKYHRHPSSGNASPEREQRKNGSDKEADKLSKQTSRGESRAEDRPSKSKTKEGVVLGLSHIKDEFYGDIDSPTGTSGHSRGSPVTSPRFQRLWKHQPLSERGKKPQTTSTTLAVDHLVQSEMTNTSKQFEHMVQAPEGQLSREGPRYSDVFSPPRTSYRPSQGWPADDGRHSDNISQTSSVRNTIPSKWDDDYEEKGKARNDGDELYSPRYGSDLSDSRSKSLSSSPTKGRHLKDRPQSDSESEKELSQSKGRYGTPNEGSKRRVTPDASAKEHTRSDPYTSSHGQRDYSSKHSPDAQTEFVRVSTPYGVKLRRKSYDSDNDSEEGHDDPPQEIRSPSPLPSSVAKLQAYASDNKSSESEQEDKPHQARKTSPSPSRKKSPERGHRSRDSDDNKREKSKRDRRKSSRKSRSPKSRKHRSSDVDKHGSDSESHHKARSKRKKRSHSPASKSHSPGQRSHSPSRTKTKEPAPKKSLLEEARQQSYYYDSFLSKLKDAYTKKPIPNFETFDITKAPEDHYANPYSTWWSVINYLLDNGSNKDALEYLEKCLPDLEKFATKDLEPENSFLWALSLATGKSYCAPNTVDKQVVTEDWMFLCSGTSNLNEYGSLIDGEGKPTTEAVLGTSFSMSIPHSKNVPISKAKVEEVPDTSTGGETMEAISVEVEGHGGESLRPDGRPKLVSPSVSSSKTTEEFSPNEKPGGPKKAARKSSLFLAMKQAVAAKKRAQEIPTKRSRRSESEKKAEPIEQKPTPEVESLFNQPESSYEDKGDEKKKQLAAAKAREAKSSKEIVAIPYDVDIANIVFPPSPVKKPSPEGIASAAKMQMSVKIEAGLNERTNAGVRESMDNFVKDLKSMLDEKIGRKLKGSKRLRISSTTSIRHLNPLSGNSKSLFEECCEAADQEGLSIVADAQVQTDDVEGMPPIQLLPKQQDADETVPMDIDSGSDEEAKNTSRMNNEKTKVEQRYLVAQQGPQLKPQTYQQIVMQQEPQPVQQPYQQVVAQQEPQPVQQPYQQVVAQQEPQPVQPSYEQVVAQQEPQPVQPSYEQVVAQQEPQPVQPYQQVVAQQEPQPVQPPYQQVVAQQEPQPVQQTYEQVVAQQEPQPVQPPYQQVVAQQEPQPVQQPYQQAVAQQEPQPVQPYQQVVAQQEPQPVQPYQQVVAQQEPQPVQPYQQVVAQEPQPVQPYQQVVAQQEPQPVQPPYQQVVAQEPQPVQPPYQQVVAQQEPQPVQPPYQQVVAQQEPQPVQPYQQVVAQQEPQPVQPPYQQVAQQEPQPVQPPYQQVVAQQEPQPVEPYQQVVAQQEPQPVQPLYQQVVAQQEPQPVQPPYQQVVAQQEPQPVQPSYEQVVAQQEPQPVQSPYQQVVAQQEPQPVQPYQQVVAQQEPQPVQPYQQVVTQQEPQPVQPYQQVVAQQEPQPVQPSYQQVVAQQEPQPVQPPYQQVVAQQEPQPVQPPYQQVVAQQEPQPVQPSYEHVVAQQEPQPVQPYQQVVAQQEPQPVQPPYQQVVAQQEPQPVQPSYEQVVAQQEPQPVQPYQQVVTQQEPQPVQPYQQVVAQQEPQPVQTYQQVVAQQEPEPVQPPYQQVVAQQEPQPVRPYQQVVAQQEPQPVRPYQQVVAQQEPQPVQPYQQVVAQQEPQPVQPYQQVVAQQEPQPVQPYQQVVAQQEPQPVQPPYQQVVAQQEPQTVQPYQQVVAQQEPQPVQPPYQQVVAQQEPQPVQPPYQQVVAQQEQQQLVNVVQSQSRTHRHEKDPQPVAQLYQQEQQTYEQESQSVQQEFYQQEQEPQAMPQLYQPQTVMEPQPYTKEQQSRPVAQQPYQLEQQSEAVHPQSVEEPYLQESEAVQSEALPEQPYQQEQPHTFQQTVQQPQTLQQELREVQQQSVKEEEQAIQQIEILQQQPQTMQQQSWELQQSQSVQQQPEAISHVVVQQPYQQIQQSQTVEQSQALQQQPEAVQQQPHVVQELPQAMQQSSWEEVQQQEYQPRSVQQYSDISYQGQPGQPLQQHRSERQTDILPSIHHQYSAQVEQGQLQQMQVQHEQMPEMDRMDYDETAPGRKRVGPDTGVGVEELARDSKRLKLAEASESLAAGTIATVMEMESDEDRPLWPQPPTVPKDHQGVAVYQYSMSSLETVVSLPAPPSPPPPPPPPPESPPAASPPPPPPPPPPAPLPARPLQQLSSEAGPVLQPIQTEPMSEPTNVDTGHQEPQPQSYLAPQIAIPTTVPSVLPASPAALVVASEPRQVESQPQMTLMSPLVHTPVSQGSTQKPTIVRLTGKAVNPSSPVFEDAYGKVKRKATPTALRISKWDMKIPVNLAKSSPVSSGFAATLATIAGGETSPSLPSSDLPTSKPVSRDGMAVSVSVTSSLSTAVTTMPVSSVPVTSESSLLLPREETPVVQAQPLQNIFSQTSTVTSATPHPPEPPSMTTDVAATAMSAAVESEPIQAPPLPDVDMPIEPKPPEPAPEPCTIADDTSLDTSSKDQGDAQISQDSTANVRSGEELDTSSWHAAVAPSTSEATTIVSSLGGETSTTPSVTMSPTVPKTTGTKGITLKLPKSLGLVSMEPVEIPGFEPTTEEPNQTSGQEMTQGACQGTGETSLASMTSTVTTSLFDAPDSTTPSVGAGGFNLSSIPLPPGSKSPESPSKSSKWQQWKQQQASWRQITGVPSVTSITEWPPRQTQPPPMPADPEPQPPPLPQEEPENPPMPSSETTPDTAVQNWGNQQQVTTPSEAATAAAIAVAAAAAAYQQQYNMWYNQQGWGNQSGQYQQSGNWGWGQQGWGNNQWGNNQWGNNQGQWDQSHWGNQGRWDQSGQWNQDSQHGADWYNQSNWNQWNNQWSNYNQQYNMRQHHGHHPRHGGHYMQRDQQYNRQYQQYGGGSQEEPPRKLPAKKVRVHVFNQDEPICRSTQQLLTSFGAKTFDPNNLRALEFLDVVEVLILVHFEDVRRIHQVPNLLAIKQNNWIKFVSYKSLWDVRNRTYQEIMTSGGFVVPDDSILLTLQPGTLEQICEFMMMRRNEREPWCLMVHAHIMHQLQQGREDDRMRQLHLILTRYEGEGVVRILLSPDFDTTPRPPHEYLSVMLRLQSESVHQHRHAVILTDLPQSDTRTLPFLRQGISVMNASSFSRVIVGKPALPPIPQARPYYGMKSNEMYQDTYLSTAVDMLSCDGVGDCKEEYSEAPVTEQTQSEAAS